jgi:hypothetical protein
MTGRDRCWSAELRGVVESTVPVTVEGITDATAVEVSSDHRCALLADHRVVCWGDTFRGKLGNGTTVASLTPVEVAF